ncbi:MAG: aldehyde dehydrogenase family protein, partial [Geminicoccaceae bacterium]|nr:aldehyde dehydrogenase family protein [Geminicoccaceae bacterium]
MLHKNLIGGEWVEGVGVSKNVNPSNTDDVVGEYAQADKAQVEAAIAEARAAFAAWAATPVETRAD